MATIPNSHRYAVKATIGALSAATLLVSPMAVNAAATPPPPTPVVSGATVHFVKNNDSYLALQTTPCAGCKLLVSATYGADAAYPTSPHSAGAQALEVVHGTDAVMLTDLTTFKLSIWQVDGGVRSASPAHLSVKVGEDLYQLQTHVTVSAKGPHSLTVSYLLLGADIESDLTKLEIFDAVGHHAPGTASTPPSGKPAWTCVMPKCPPAVYPDVTVKGLRDRHTYSFSVYGFDAHGHVARSTAHGFVVGIGSYVGNTELASNDQVAPGSLAVDRSSGIHELLFSDLTHSDLGRLTYVTRGAGQSGFTTTTVAGAKGADTAFITPTVSGTALDVVMATCSTLDVMQVSADTSALPAFGERDEAVGQRRCLGEDGLNKSPDLQGIVALAHGKLALLFDNDPVHPGSDPHATVYIGAPGHRFHKTVLPGSINKAFSGFIARDASTSKVYVAKADPAGDAVDVWTLGPAPHTSWSRPARAAALTADDAVTSLAVARGRIFVGVYRERNGNDGFSRPTPAGDGAFITERSAAGKWSALARLPHSSRFAQGILLAARPQDGSVWELDALVRLHGGRAANGLEERHFTAGAGWSTPARLSRVQGDSLDNLVGNWRGGATYDHEIFN